MISVEKKCDICYHQRKMSCPSSEKCYSRPDKPFFVLKPNAVVVKYPETLIEKVKIFFKKLKGE